MTVLSEALARALECQLLVKELAKRLGRFRHEVRRHYVEKMVALARGSADRASVLAGIDDDPVSQAEFYEEVIKEKNSVGMNEESERRAKRAHDEMRSFVEGSWDDLGKLLGRIAPLAAYWSPPLVRYGTDAISQALKVLRKETRLSPRLVVELPRWNQPGLSAFSMPTEVLFIDEVFVALLKPHLSEASPEEAAYLLGCVSPGPGWGPGIGAMKTTRDAVEGELDKLLWRALQAMTEMREKDFEEITDWDQYRVQCVPLALSLVDASRRTGRGVGDPFDWFVILGGLLDGGWFRWTRRDPAELLRGVVEGLTRKVEGGEMSAEEGAHVAREVASFQALRNLRPLRCEMPSGARSACVRRAVSAMLREVTG